MTTTRTWLRRWPIAAVALCLVVTGAIVWNSVGTAEPARKPSTSVSLSKERALFTDDQSLTISVLGDSTGDGDGEWVALLSKAIAKTHAVTYHSWSRTTLTWNDPIAFSTDGPTVNVWNMSASGQTAAYPAPLLDKGQPTEPDLVLYSFGHNNTVGSIGPEMRLTADAVKNKWGVSIPSIVILQNPSLGDRAKPQTQKVQLLRSTIAPSLGMPSIDVYAAFAKAGPPLQYLPDGLHPNSKGSKLWADTVIHALLT